jgi:hypothetical protein
LQFQGRFGAPFIFQERVALRFLFRHLVSHFHDWTPWRRGVRLHHSGQGVATAIPPVAIEALLARGDAALYCAKSNGRNRVEFDQAEASPAPAPAVIPTLGQAVAALR